MANMIEVYTPREAATLAATVVEKTAAVPCFMRRLASFEITAANAATLSAVALEVCNLDPTVNGNWRVAAAANIMQLLGTANGVALNAGGRVVVACTLSEKSPKIPWRYCRLSLTAGGSDVTDLQVSARTYADAVLTSLSQPYIRSVEGVE